MNIYLCCFGSKRSSNREEAEEEEKEEKKEAKVFSQGECLNEVASAVLGKMKREGRKRASFVRSFCALCSSPRASLDRLDGYRHHRLFAGRHRALPE